MLGEKEIKEMYWKSGNVGNERIQWTDGKNQNQKDLGMNKKNKNGKKRIEGLKKRKKM